MDYLCRTIREWGQNKNGVQKQVKKDYAAMAGKTALWSGTGVKSVMY